MKQLALILFLSISLFSTHTAYPLSLDYYGIVAEIMDNDNVKHLLTFKFSEPIGHIDYALDTPIYNLSFESKFISSCSSETISRGSAISCDFIGMTSEKNAITLSFETKNSVKETDSFKQFSINYGIPLKINRSFVMVMLPKQIFLGKEPENESYFPSSGSTIVEGRRIKVYWEKENLSENDSLRFSVLYSPNKPFSTNDFISTPDAVFFGLAGIIVIVFISLIIYTRLRQGVSTISDVLNNDERKIVAILEASGGKILQKTIVKETGFSKAKVSRIIKSLHNRNIVSIEAVSGRENRIILKVRKVETKPVQQEDEKREIAAGAVK
ncbi:MAG: hypothetical protein HYU33_02820 [Candidatus Omnitrophica bacterium]|nr:hypothetical protein [Candidatus Omnitrophota bacterium]MBI2674851.1 hypothetical protein [Candidatus Aenigmarchaeota archaeon]